MLEFYQTNKKSIHNILIVFLAIVFTYFFFHFIFRFISPFVIGWLLSLLFYPVAVFLHKKCHFPFWLGSLFAIVLFLGFLCSVVTAIILKLNAEASLFYQSLPNYFETIQAALSSIALKIEETVDLLPPVLQNHISGSSNFNLVDIAASLLKNSNGASFTTVMVIPNMIMILLVGLISSYFFTKDKKEIAAFTAKHLPASFVETFRLVKKDLLSSISGYFKTQLILMTYTFTICLGGLFILQSPYALLLSVITSIIDAIPFFGSGFILWPGALLFIITGKTFMAVGYSIIYLLISLMRQIMQPKILGTQIGLHPLPTLISMYIGLKLLGVMGMIIGPVVAVLLKAIDTIKTEKAQELEALKKSLYEQKR